MQQPLTPPCTIVYGIGLHCRTNTLPAKRFSNQQVNDIVLSINLRLPYSTCAKGSTPSFTGPLSVSVPLVPNHSSSGSDA